MNQKQLKKISGSLDMVLDYAQKNDYKGYNKYDALDSPILNFLSLKNQYLKLVYSQTIMRFPINIRPIFLVPQTINPKGMALFSMAYLNRYKALKSKEDLEKAEKLINWLLNNYSEGFSGKCWGYQYPWQDVGFFARPNLPNRVVSFFVGSALMDAYEITGKQIYFDTVKDVLNFILKDPKVIFEDQSMKCLSYVPDERITWMVMDVSALCSSLIARINKTLNDAGLKEEAKKLIHFVVDKQTDYGAWFYTHPRGKHIKMHDNYHTGYIIDAILDYMDYTGDKSYRKNYIHGLEYYIKHLFLSNGAPKWMNNRIYPLDVHGSAQGIISFLKAKRFGTEYVDFAYKIAEWAINNMQNKKEGFFYYQKKRFYKKPFTIMHWSNGWMALALSKLLLDSQKNTKN
jgi:uncharacterized protein YyaL (SSP411 family)